MMSLALYALACQIDLRIGAVSIVGKIQVDEVVQNVSAYVGQEQWEDPFRVRKICEQLGKEITTLQSTSWLDYGCDGTIGVSRKVLDYGLTATGKKLIGRETLRFFPDTPISRDFLKNYESPSCDPL